MGNSLIREEDWQMFEIQNIETSTFFCEPWPSGLQKISQLVRGILEPFFGPDRLSNINHFYKRKEGQKMMKRLFAVSVLLVLAAAGWVGFRSFAAVVADSDSDENPRQVVEAFYDAYFNSMGDRSSGEFHNPLVEKTYRELPQISPALMERVDAELEASESIAYDPFLCAQDIPGNITVKEVIIDSDLAVVVVETDFVGHRFTVELEQMDAVWKIRAVLCE
jgi:hypothetical protein